MATTTESRASVESIKEAYDHLFNSGTTLSRLRDAALTNRFLPNSRHDPDKLEVPGRSIAWKLFLAHNEPLNLALDPNLVLDSLRASRKHYVEQLREKMRAPDGSYEDGFVVPGLSLSPRREASAPGNLEMNNPLSLHVENPWTDWFTAVELRKTILQDVERTFPEIEFFRNPEVQSQLTNVLYLYSASNPSIGYRQGMHELLAPLYHAVAYDSLEDEVSDSKDSTMRELCSRTWIAADAWTLFNSVMLGVSRWYEWREPDASAAAGTTSPLANHVHLNIPEGQLEIKPYIAPIVQACNRVQSTLLRSADPQLWKHMQATGIEPQIYGIRWLRLLFTREFNMPDAMKLWDGLFACDSTFELAPWICVAMLIRIRNELLPSDYTGQLTVLLRYPSPQTTDGSTHHTSLLLRQAIALQLTPTPSAGVSLMMENRNLLNIPMEVPDPPPAPRRRPAHDPRNKSASGPSDSSGRRPPGRQPPSQQMGFSEMFARGLMDRGESLGINKTLMSAVSELRRNIPDLAASLASVRSPSTTYAAFPLTDERPPEERPPWEPKSRFEMEKELAAQKSTNKQLGESLSWIVDVLLQDESQASDLQRLQKQKREALESLSYARDILIGNVSEIEPERLLSEEEARRKRQPPKNESNGQANPALEIPKPVAPALAPVIDGRLSSSNSRAPQVQASRPPPQLLHVDNVSTARAPMQSSQTPTSAVSSSPVPNSARLAPWNYTRSSFSGGSSSLPATTLPRPPPPTSATLRRTVVNTSPPPQGVARTLKQAEPKPVSPRQPHDPLGVT